MAGVKGRSGGARPGTGPKKKGVLDLTAELAKVEAQIAKRAGVAAKPIEEDAKKEILNVQASIEEKRELMEQLFPKGSRDPLEFLLDVMQMVTLSPDLRIRAAMKAVDFQHKKVSEAGKKEERQEAAESAQTGRFAPTAPPRLVSNRKD